MDSGAIQVGNRGDGARVPNVLIIYADDLGWGDLACFGSQTVETPTIDRIRQDGVKLSRWYSNSPVCSPSRASLLTGKYPAHAGVQTILGGGRKQQGLPHQPTIATELKRRGYVTGLFGKWHLGVAPEYAPSNFGFDEVFGFRAGCVDYYSHIFYWGDVKPAHDLWDGEKEIWRNGEYLTTMIGRQASDFIARHAGEPFFCYVPFNAPHYPLHAPQSYLDQFRHLPDDQRIMAAMVLAMDEAIGRIVNTLEEHGLYRDTLIFFSSDNGPSEENANWLNGEEISYKGGSAGGLRGSKGSVFEGGIRVPTVVSWPAVLPGGSESLTTGLMMDVMPTILDAVDECLEDAGIGAPGPTPNEGKWDPERVGEDGTSQLQVFTRPASTDPQDRLVFWTYQGQWAVRRGRYKYVENAREGIIGPPDVESALYDLETDRAEQNDLSAEHPQIVRMFREELAVLRAQDQLWDAI